MPDDAAQGPWYYCLRHQRVEGADRCGSELLMGPYPSREEAQRYAETAARRNDAWEEEDKRWQGD